MEEYIQKYNQFNKSVIYSFELGAGGIGDCIKFFMLTLEYCIKYNYKLYYQYNNLPLEKYLILKYPFMYITKETVDSKKSRIVKDINWLKDVDSIEEDQIQIVTPFSSYHAFSYDLLQIPIADVFDFSDVVKENAKNMLLENIGSDFITIHLRLGDKYLETDPNFVKCKNDTRLFHENNLYACIQHYLNQNKKIIFFCDNHQYKLKIKEKFPQVIITHSQIGHTSLLNTTDGQICDTVTEFYIMTQANMIIAASHSGFSSVSAKFKNVPFIRLY